MLARMDSPVRLAGDSPRALFRRAVLDNPRVSDEMLAAMDAVPLDALASTSAVRERAVQRIPKIRQLDTHQFCVVMIAGVTGLSRSSISDAVPDLGVMGGANLLLFHAPRSPRLGRGTALHDFTDYLRWAGVAGLNKAVWGAENDVLSALIMFVGGGRF